ncbi:uncharacterized protein BDV17DRAFT_285104 [Aspergillus undulatus]|uniref:uncharacterized protein n=1 Tax=Aspergillus undulatus TaxID=1810928 RepID=UPI003CCD959D
MSDSSSSDASTFGWALRVNGSCLEQEEDCGPTLDPYRVCCPGGSFCPNAYNYINGGYFCCEHGTTGYAKEGGSNGCGSPGYVLGEGETKLEIISTGTVSTSTPTSTPTNSTSTPTSTTTQTSSESNHSSGSDAGAIAGGVIGGAAGAALIIALIWFLMRMRRQRQAPPHFPTQGMASIPESYCSKELPAQGNSLVEMDGHRPQELGGDYRVVAELPGYYGR